jgi:SecD/SecF fusion protein
MKQYSVDERGYYGEFGGAFIPEILHKCVTDLKKAYLPIMESSKFQQDFNKLLQDYVGRPSPLYLSRQLSERFGAKIYLKREDLNHTGAHKINNTIGQILIAREMGKTRIIAETGAGQHGVATATVCALMQMPCTVYMGETDVKRQQVNVKKMEMLGATVVPVTSGNMTLKDATNEAIRDWCSHPSDTHYIIGSTIGPHPYPDMVARLQSVISKEIKVQLTEKEGRDYPDYLVACVGGYVYSAPRVNDRIEGGRSSISGDFSSQEAQDLENVLKSGKMQAGIRIVQEDVVGPSLGQEAIKDGFISFIIALVVLFIFTMMLYGFVPGTVINVALLLNFFFTLGILAAFQAVLTLPGIAGMILSLAMAVDANVLINERIKEELATGKSLRRALDDGYKNAFSAIFDSNLTTIITGIILVIFGVGAIRGFAVTLIIGIAASFLTAVFITRMFYEYQLSRGKWQNLTFQTHFSRAIYREYAFDFLKNSKNVIIGIAIFVVVSIASLFTLGLNSGIDFTGGRNYIVRFDQPVNTQDVEDALVPYFGESVRVITIGSSNQVRVSTNYMIEEDGTNVEEELRDLLGQGMAEFMTPGMSIDDHIMSSQKVGPSIAEDMLNNAFLSLLIALICMGLYIMFRFNNWGFSMGTVAALAIDAFSVIGLYSLLWRVMPFSMEMDQTFVAAILTIVGYSINDKVVVFDRVREYMTLYPKRGLRELFNDSMNATLARTINTGLSTILVIIVILFLGGDAVRSFVFAMLIGVVVGTITSLFIAAPVAYKIMLKKNKKEIVAA